MIKRKPNKFLSYLLLLAMLTASIPFHQIFHKHTYNASAKVVDDHGVYKTPDKPCCDILQLLPHAILVSFDESLAVTQIDSYVIVAAVLNFSSSLNLFLNKAPPVVLA